ncbi:MAG TPA: Spy/CpxP family protein refolding chaperone [Caulobacteraceae bacterium]|nr:Spy/CpxP family protein refolding chaperone [Caulobacteraceae bacterium]
MIAYRIPALALAAVLAVSAAAHAQTPPPPARGAMAGGAGAQTWAPGSQLRHAAREAAHLKALHDALNIRSDQEGAFQAFAASMRPGERGERSGDMGRESHDMAAMTTPERLDAMGRMMDEHVARMHERFQRHATAVKALYAVLSPDQRRTLDALPDLMGHGMGGHGMGMDMGHEHMEHQGEHSGDHAGMGMDHPGERE